MEITALENFQSLVVDEPKGKPYLRIRLEATWEKSNNTEGAIESKIYYITCHGGVIAHFNQNYVKKGIFPKETSKIIRLASEKREKADYLDFYVASKDEAKAQIERAEAFSKWIGDYLRSKDIL